jgi:phage portal protein BeeE
MGLIRELRDFITAFSYPDNFLGFGTAAPSQAGVQVNELSSLQSAAIVGCIRIISGLQASLPLNVMEITKTGRRVATDHPIQYLLNSQPNPETDSYMFKETLQVHLLLAGNA